MSLLLYTYFRSSAAFRVRIALNLKQLPYEAVAVHLLRNGGEQHQAAFKALNPEGLVPVLQDGEALLTQSMAIIEYLEECFPQPALLPSTPLERARVRALAHMIACDIHPLNNLRVLQYLTGRLQLDDNARDDWYRHWVAVGLEAVEAQLARSPDTGAFCHGDQPGMADCCLVPQIYNAQRWKCDLAPYPIIRRIVDSCMANDAFVQASPPNQFDAVS